MSLTLYRSSAGSGKTFTLAKEYLKLVLPHPDNYRRILAMTFTNAAAAEMKERILQNLVKLRDEKDANLKLILLEEGVSENDIANAGAVLKSILADYSNFAVVTIDSFFNRILRSFGKELGLPMNFEVGMDTDEVMEYALDEILSRAGEEPRYRKLLLDYIHYRLQDNKSWKIEKDILNLGKQFLKETASAGETLSADEADEILRKIFSDISQFEGQMKQLGQRGIDEMQRHGLQPSDFHYGTGGVINAFYKAVSGNYDLQGARVAAAMESLDGWVGKKAPNREQVIQAVEESLMQCLHDLINHCDQHLAHYHTCKLLAKTFPLFLLLEKMGDVLQKYRDENELVLISDFNKILAEHISREPVPFVYSRVGIKYMHYLVDEFQDTSKLQWNNLQPLLETGLSEGNYSMLVGDAKQAIYRWRGGEVGLIEELDSSQLMHYLQEQSLGYNWRSAPEIIEFNNSFFQKAVEGLPVNPLLEKVYKTLRQNPREGNKDKGYAEVNIYSKGGRSNEEFHEWVREKTSQTLQELRQDGYSYGDVCMLFRGKKEGAMMAEWLQQEGIPLISQESLFVENSPIVQLLLTSFRWLLHPGEVLYREELLYFYLLAKEKDWQLDISAVINDRKKAVDALLPAELFSRSQNLIKLPAYNAAEELISIFNLTEKGDAYLLAFLEVALQEGQNSDGSIGSFLDNWQDGKHSISAPENSDSVRLMTIHKSKGLEFPVVMVPFACWPFSPGNDDYLWIEKPAGFEKLGIFPVAERISLAKSTLEAEYSREKELKLIDNLNLLYVAFTRAKYRLYANADCNKKNEDPKNVSQIVHNVLADEAEDKGEYLQYTHGSKATNPVPVKLAEKPSEVLFPGTHWQEKLTVKPSPDGHRKKSSQTKDTQHLRYGQLVHQVLASVTAKNEVPRHIAILNAEGSVTAEEAQELEKEVLALFELSEVQQWFGSGHTVMAERDILLPGGQVYRPDRVLISAENEAIVVDYKTGSPSPYYHAQLEKYASVLQQMGYTCKEKYLLYIDEKRVERVD